MLRVGVIGTGFMGQNHARVYSEIAKLIGICDSDERVGKQVAKRFNIKYCKDISKLLENIDAVTVATPTSMHFEIAKKALEAGKHVLVEKPICNNIADAEKLCELASQLGLTLSVGHVERYNPAVELAKFNLEQGQFGDIISFSAKRVSPPPSRIKDVGVIPDLGIHEIDNCRYLVGSEVEKVQAFGGSRNHEFEDFAIISLAFQNSVCAHIEANWLTPMKVRRASLTCSKAFVEIDYAQQLLQISSARLREFDQADMSNIPWEYNMHRFPLKKQEPLKLELQDFLDAIKSKRAPLVAGEDGLAALRIAEAAIQSYKKGEMVKL